MKILVAAANGFIRRAVYAHPAGWGEVGVLG